MEIMASKTLNEQPVNKMIKLGGGDEEDVNANNFNKLNNNLQQQNCGDAAKYIFFYFLGNFKKITSTF